jgi:hypothetical protein
LALATSKVERGRQQLVYGTGDIRVGTYSSTDLANLGIGHGALDGGASYTYLNHKTGREFSAVAGFTYNLENPSTGGFAGTDYGQELMQKAFGSKAPRKRSGQALCRRLRRLSQQERARQTKLR